MPLRSLWARQAAVPPAVKASAAGPLIAWSHTGRPQWTPRRYDALAEEGFRKNVIAYRCITMVAQAAAQIPWLLYDNAGQDFARHPLLDLLDRPNPLQDGVALREALIATYLIAGNVYLEAVRPRDGGRPREIYPLRPDRMKVIPGASGFPQGYEYQVAGQTTRWAADILTGKSDILHIKHFHPLDDWYGLAPLEAALLAVDQHNAAGGWNQALLKNGARPSGALVFAPKEGPATLSEEQVRRLKEQLDEYYQGQRNAGRPMLLEGGLEWRPMSLSPTDMDWLRGRDTAARDIALALGVPSQLIGLPDGQTYANKQEARLAFYEETVLPLLQRFIAAFNHWLAPMFGAGLTLEADLDAVSTLADRRDAVWDKLQRVEFLTINEKRAAAGYTPRLRLVSALSDSKGREVRLRAPTVAEKKLVERSFMDAYRQAVRESAAGVTAYDLKIAEVNLDDSGAKEVLVVIDSPLFCGTIGCELTIWQKRDGRWRDIGKGTVPVLQDSPAVMLLDSRTDGYHDLTIGCSRHVWNGSSY